MRKTKLLIAVALASGASAALAAGPTAGGPYGADPAVYARPSFWAASNFVTAGELEREALDRAGFPQYSD